MLHKICKILFFLLVCIFFTPSYLSASDDVYTIDNIEVLITNAKSAKAIKLDALDMAQDIALSKLLDQLNYQQTEGDFISEHVIDLMQLVKNIKVRDEVIDGHNYKGTYSVTFRKNEFDEILAKNRLNTRNSNTRIMVVPVFYHDNMPVIWNHNNIWKDAWDRMSIELNSDNLIIPIGDLSDIRQLEISDIMELDFDKIKKFASKYNVAQLFIVEAVFDGEYLEINLHELKVDGFADYTQHYNFSSKPSDNMAIKRQFLSAASEDIYRKILSESEFIKLNTSNIYSIDTILYINNIKHYTKLNKILENIDFIKPPQVIEASSEYVSIRLFHKKGIATFVTFLYKHGVAIVDDSGVWKLELMD